MIVRKTKRYNAQTDDLGLGDGEKTDIENKVRDFARHGHKLVGNVRNIRVPLQGRGSRGGARVFYAHFTCVSPSRLYLLQIYDRRTQKGISKEQLALMRELSEKVSKALCK